MKHIKIFEDFIAEQEAMQVTPDSKVEVDTYTTDNGLEIKSSEIVGIVSSAKTEKEFKDYFYDTYGQGEFTTNDIETLCTYFMEYEEELVAAETEAEEAEKEEEGGGEEEDPLGDIEI
jgi:hypothetical protein